MEERSCATPVARTFWRRILSISLMCSGPRVVRSSAQGACHRNGGGNRRERRARVPSLVGGSSTTISGPSFFEQPNHCASSHRTPTRRTSQCPVWCDPTTPARRRSLGAGRVLSSRRHPHPDLRFATHPSLGVDESDARIRHLGGLGRALGINGRDASTGKASTDLGGGRSGRALSGNALAPPGQRSVRRWRSSSPSCERTGLSVATLGTSARSGNQRRDASCEAGSKPRPPR
jgi:hypothetical protein